MLGGAVAGLAADRSKAGRRTGDAAHAFLERCTPMSRSSIRFMLPLGARSAPGDSTCGGGIPSTGETSAEPGALAAEIRTRDASNDAEPRHPEAGLEGDGSGQHARGDDAVGQACSPASAMAEPSADVADARSVAQADYDMAGMADALSDVPCTAPAAPTPDLPARSSNSLGMPTQPRTAPAAPAIDPPARSSKSLGMPTIKLDETDTVRLRFAVGDRVECNCGQWQIGTIIKIFYTQKSFPAGMWAPYLVKLDSGRKVFAKHDVDSMIRPTRAQ